MGLLLAAFALTPAASALGAAEGAFLIRSVTFPDGSQLSSGSVHGFLWEGRAALGGFAFSAPMVTACYVEMKWFRVDAAGNPFMVRTPDRKEACYTLTNTNATIQPKLFEGYVGLHAMKASLSMVAEGVLTAAPSGPSAIRDRGTDMATVTKDPEAYNFRGFVERIESNHIVMECAGLVRYEGAGALVLRGPTVRLASRENTTTYVTGDYEVAGELVPQEVNSWLYLSFDDGLLTFSAPTPLRVGVTEAEGVATDGTLHFQAKSGVLRTPTAAYTPVPGRVESMDGSFTASVSPALDSDEASLRVQGSVRATSMAASQVAPALPLVGQSPGLLLMFVLGAVVVGAGAGGGLCYVRFRRRLAAAREHPFNLETCLDATSIALEDAAKAEDAGDHESAQEEYERALTWAWRGLALDPERRAFLEDAALCLYKLGRGEEALVLLEEAHARAQPPGVALAAARLAVQMGKPTEVVAEWARRSFERSGAELHDFMSEFPELTSLPQWPRLRALAESHQPTE